jgi:hypothetical protein
MTRTISILIILVLIAGGFWFYAKQRPSVDIANDQTSNSKPWHRFTAPQGKFTVSVPSLPHHATETKEDPETHTKRIYDFYLSSKDNGTIYTINTIAFPPKEAGGEYDETFLRDFVQKMLSSNPENKIIKMDVKPFRNKKALDFKVENAEVTIDGKALFDDNILYILSTTSRNDQRDESEFHQFIDSFQLPSKG